MTANGPFVHWRSSSGTALCGLPAKQDQLANGWETVNCPYCQRRSGVAIRQMRGVA